MQPSEPNQEARLVSGLAHIAVLFSALGLALNIGLLIYYRRRSSFSLAHIKQALGLQVLSIILSWTVGLYVIFAGFGVGFGQIDPGFFFGRAMLTGIFLFLINGVKLALVILGAIKAFSGEEYRQPLIGNLIAQIGE